MNAQVKLKNKELSHRDYLKYDIIGDKDTNTSITF